MKKHFGYLLALSTITTIIACSKGADTSTLVDDSTQVGTVTPQATLPPAPTTAPATPLVPTGPTGQFQSAPQNTQFAPFTGWPHYNYNNQSQNWGQAYPQGYQTSNYSHFPNYHYGWNRPYYFAAITELYRRFLGRNPDQHGAHFFVREAIAGRPRSHIVDAFLQSQEVRLLGDPIHVQNVIALFRIFMGRLPYNGALAHWVQQLAGGTPLTTIAPQFGSGWFTTPVTDLFKSILARHPNQTEYQTQLTALRSGSKSYVNLIDELRASAEATSLGRIIAENCIFIHRIVTGYVPQGAEVAQCVAKGDNTQLNSGNYNTILQQYAQELMNRVNGQYPHYP